MRRFMILISLLICMLSIRIQAEPIQEPIKEAITTFLMDELQLDQNQYEIDVISCRLHAKEADPANLTFKPISQKEPLGLYTIIVQIMDGDNIKEASQVRVRIKKFEDVLVVSDRFKRHEVLDDRRTEVRRMDVSDLRSQAYYSVDETEGYRVKSSIQKGTIVTMNLLEKIPDIEAGKVTTIVYSQSGFQITAEGVAMQTGSTGEYIKVKNKTSNKIVIARIIDSNNVAVDP